MSTVTTEQPKHSPALLSAVERALAAHSLRLKTDQDLGNIANAITAKGFQINASNGYLEASQTTAGHTQPVHVSRLLEGLAQQEPTRFYARDTGGVTSRDQLDARGKIEYLRTHSLAEWERLPQAASAVQTVYLDPNRMKRSEWLSLDRKTKADFLKQHGANAVGQIMARK